MTKTRNKRETIEIMLLKANELTKKYSYDLYSEIWEMASDWNRNHEDEEIFMCDYQSDNSEFVNGFMVEDYVFIIED